MGEGTEKAKDNITEGTDETTIFGIFHRKAIPDGATPVDNFDLSKYLGVWYEIARLNFYWENHDMTNVTAEYTLGDEEGVVGVKNTGFDEKKNEWSSYEGTATFRGDNTLAALAVSFFGPIKAGYNVLSVDGSEDGKYKYALVAGRSTDYLWFLSREKEMPEEIKAKYLKMAEEIGFTTDDLNWVDQTKTRVG